MDSDKYKPRILPTVAVDASTHAALLSVVENTGDTLANITNQILYLGLVKYGVNPQKFKADARAAAALAVRARKLLTRIEPERVTIKGFRIPAELAEDMRHEQGWRSLPEVMGEALRWWVEKRRDMPMPVKPEKEKFSAVHKKRAVEYAAKATEREATANEPALLEWDNYPETVPTIEEFKARLARQREEDATPATHETTGGATDSAELSLEGDFC